MFALLMFRRSQSPRTEPVSLHSWSLTGSLHTFLLLQVTKKHFKIRKNVRRDGMPKKQPNKVGMTPQYSYGLSSLYLLLCGTCNSYSVDRMVGTDPLLCRVKRLQEVAGRDLHDLH